MVTMSRFNPIRVLSSVPLAVVLIVLTGGLITGGFARPWLRTTGIGGWPILRDWLGRTDSQFFNSWPIQILTAVLLANLIVVTWRKVPLTRCWYGMWCLSAGLIMLVCGSWMHFHFKVAGRVRIYQDPNAGPAIVDHFYDGDERSLFVRIGQEQPVEIPLPRLPRFTEYDDRLGNTGYLNRRGLTGIEPTLEITDQTSGKTHPENLAELIGCRGQQLKFDVVGFYPHAEIRTEFTTDPASSTSGVGLTIEKSTDQWWLVGSNPRFREDDIHTPADLRHVDADAQMVSVLTDAAGKLFHLDVTLPNLAITPMDVQIGKSYPVGNTGYTLQIERFIPNFPMSGTGERVADLMMRVTAPTQSFKRMVLEGKPIQTDFKLDDPSAGPMGARQKAPLDPGLVINFRVHDPYRLLPEQHSVRHTLLTPPGGSELIDIVAGFGDVASVVNRFPTGAGDIEIKPPGDPMGAPDPMAKDLVLKVHAERHDHLRTVDSVVIPGAEHRDKTSNDAGLFQLAKLKATMGDWTGFLYAPFAEQAGDRLGQDQWQAGFILPPGAIAPLQVQLGNTRRPLPARLTLDLIKRSSDGEAAGEEVVSNITLSSIDSDAGAYTAVVKTNHPIYFDHDNWIFSQAGFDSIAQQWTQLDVANRPAMNVLRLGCGLVLVGTIYTIYIGLKMRRDGSPFFSGSPQG